MTARGSLTDGYGGMVVMNTLAAEYLRLKYAVSVPVTDTLFHPDDLPAEEEQRDDYFTYAGKQMEVFKSRSVYQLPGKPLSADKVLVTTDFIDSDRILKAARCHSVSVTVFLCAVMAVSVMEIQSGNFPNGNNRIAISEIYEESWKYAHNGIIPQEYLNSIPKGKWASNSDNPSRKTLICI